MKAVVAAFNQEKALVGAFSVITNLRMELFEALITILSGAADIRDERPAGRRGEHPVRGQGPRHQVPRRAPGSRRHVVLRLRGRGEVCSSTMYLAEKFTVIFQCIHCCE